MEKKRVSIKFYVLGGIAIAVAIFCGAPNALAATLSFSPHAGTYFAGRSFSVAVQVSSPGAAINAVQGEVSFPTNDLEVLSVSKANSVLNLWVQDPTFSNQNGTVNFAGVVVNPGFEGNNGNIITITFEAKNAGTAALSINSASVLANDGNGTDILTGTQSASFAITPLVAAPANTNALPSIVITSTPFITPGEWYNINQITFDWGVPADADGVDYTISNNANLQLPDVNQGLISQTSYDLSNFADGTWYFFVSFESGGSWSPPSVKTLMLDRTPPNPFVVSRVDTNLVDNQPVFAWSANDDTSGIDHYEVKIGDGNWFDASIIQNGSSSYILPPQSPTGARTLTVRAFDKAGNYTDASITFGVLGANAACGGSSFMCGLSMFFSRWGWLIAGMLLVLLFFAYGFIYHLLRWKKSSSKELKKFEDELRRDLKAVQEETEKVRGSAVDLRPSHLEQEKRQIEKELKHISDDVKEEIKELGE